MSTHSAPSVVYPLGRSRFQAVVLLLVWLSGAALMLAWWWASGEWSHRLVAGVVAVAISGVFAWQGYRNLPVGQLVWDGQEWRRESPGYQSGSTAFELAVLADFQVMLLLRVQNQAGARLWLWAEKKAMPERWMDLRRAVYFRPSSNSAQPFPLISDSSQALIPVPSVAVSAHADSESCPVKP